MTDHTNNKENNIKAKAGKNSEINTATDNSNIYKSDGDINIYNYSDQAGIQEQEIGIIDEIIKDVINKIDNNPNTISSEIRSEKLYIEDKVKINFLCEEERRHVLEFYQDSLEKITLIEKRVRQDDDDGYKELAIKGFVQQKYLELKNNNKENNMAVLLGLFNEFTPDGYKRNEKYAYLIRSFILFFFEDCSIFKKSENEE